MSNVKNIKSIDISSATIIGTGLNILFSIIAAIVLLLGVSIIGGWNAFSGFITIACGLVFGTMIYCVFQIFAECYLYNILVKKLNPVSLTIKDNKYIEKVSVMSTAILGAVTSTIIMVIVYLASIFGIMMLSSGILQTLMYAGQFELAMTVYQLISIFSSPITAVVLILLMFISVFVAVAIGLYIFNFLTDKIGPIDVTLTQEGSMTSIDYVNPKNIAIITALISLIINVIFGIITAIGSGDFVIILINGVSGFISSFIGMALIVIFYNFLSKKLGTLKIELAE
ncbi:hypothetical protein LJB96_01640 [Methanobrevibacter sp. OttesenSCG-928-K11]|nr:hypothetical protein [Methanobrevibacter sp. OttesenSCG-928-K11]MDL2270592.1 hypothetical protein [Methanobrevibacter sp. OttesenSCG-928-I08]